VDFQYLCVILSVNIKMKPGFIHHTHTHTHTRAASQLHMNISGKPIKIAMYWDQTSGFSWF